MKSNERKEVENMNNILIISQDQKITGFCRFVGIGRRQPNLLIGEKLKSLLEERKMTVDDLISKIGNNYRRNIERIIENEEIPTKKHLEVITNAFNVESDYFDDKELENVIVTDNNLIVARYETDEKAQEIKKKIDDYILNCYLKNEKIILDLTKEEFK